MLQMTNCQTWRLNPKYFQFIHWMLSRLIWNLIQLFYYINRHGISLYPCIQYTKEYFWKQVRFATVFSSGLIEFWLDWGWGEGSDRRGDLNFRGMGGWLWGIHTPIVPTIFLCLDCFVLPYRIEHLPPGGDVYPRWGTSPPGGGRLPPVVDVSLRGGTSPPGGERLPPGGHCARLKLDLK